MFVPYKLTISCGDCAGQVEELPIWQAFSTILLAEALSTSKVGSRLTQRDSVKSNLLIERIARFYLDWLLAKSTGYAKKSQLMNSSQRIQI